MNNLDLSPYYFGEDKEDVSLKYNLIANICHTGSKPEGGFYKIQVKHQASKEWFEIIDLHIT